MQCLNATVSPLLLGAINGLVQGEGLSHEKIVQAIAELSRRFNRERSSLNQTYLDNRLLSTAYLQYFLPVNLAKIQVLLTELPAPEVVEEFSVLDIGSGPGTGALAVLDWWYQRRVPCAVSVTAIDRSTGALRQARQLWNGYCQAAGLGEIDLQTVEGDLERRAWVAPVSKRAPFDLMILANALNEVHVEASDQIIARTAFVEEALSLLDAHGTMMIVEPALRETSRALHQVRDRLLQEKHCTIYSPCLHENNCPALVKPDDWCHEERAWEPPALIQEIDSEVGFIKDALKFSYLLLRKDGKTIVDRQPDVHRVVSELRELKGEKRAWLCNETGRSEIGRQDRLASPHNKAFDQWHRGAIVQIEKIVHKERGGKVSALGRIEPDAAVRIVRPA
ncbi:MAG: small ribosomal subunit Rsm22 family protein [Nitrospira sp.]|nr:small ribosomal subunit Rsm22 family protein [Nitrospira sp.]MDH4370571.1 small ribosomal subunit Rsm22 family protein [Nitrospira sp.]MDH5349045.1 small ribosomal subunit Rsm22 family protein [Nitrospira sp.]MDH5497903.1 small ribosomal subunit Rsm22 family protein [Nitrospira sp.]MDH5726606.1 small ribosomal subunit Rsm22 family protein [Nitrospira sp.]